MFYSTKDEDAFFEWVKKITCIERFWGKGDEILLQIKRRTISNDNLIELTALFYRYKVDMPQLAIFKSKKNEKLFEVGIPPHFNMYPS